MSTEVVRWQDPAMKPDSDVTVLLHAPEASEPVWPGYWDDGEQAWLFADGAPAGYVKAWADLPKGCDR